MRATNSQAAYDYVYLGGQVHRRHQACKLISSRGPHGHLCTVQFPDGQKIDVARWNVKNISKTGGNGAPQNR